MLLRLLRYLKQFIFIVAVCSVRIYITNKLYFGVSLNQAHQGDMLFDMLLF